MPYILNMQCEKLNRQKQIMIVFKIRVNKFHYNKKKKIIGPTG